MTAEPNMLDHLTIVVSDIEWLKKFYDQILVRFEMARLSCASTIT